MATWFMLLVTFLCLLPKCNLCADEVFDANDQFISSDEDVVVAMPLVDDRQVLSDEEPLYDITDGAALHSSDYDIETGYSVNDDVDYADVGDATEPNREQEELTDDHAQISEVEMSIHGIDDDDGDDDDDDEDDDEAIVDEAPNYGNGSSNDTLDGTNKTLAELTLLNMTEEQIAANLTDKQKKITCTGGNITENATVLIVNSTELLTRLTMKNETHGICSLVLFFAPWCVFCAQTAPYYNAVPRVFPQIQVLAIDAVHFSSLNARFGTIAVPNILLFHNTKAVARFNHTERTFESIVEFVSNITGVEVNGTMHDVREEDYLGPLSSEPTQETDYLLILAWLFVMAFFSVMLYRSTTGQKIVQLLASFGQEHHHQHID